ncbi:hypothetical protein [Litoribaculum gwangyangense]|uniref:Uncharacterized protein n=1 Tax=Litoribaculum gwangyangense TaxID=1130722 RepID=A0ABP9CJC5_9FLAO
MAISNSLFSPTSENPCGFSIWFVFAKLGALNTQLTIPKHVVLHYDQPITNDKIF